MATTAPSTNPLADSLTKVTGIDPLSTTAGTSLISYDPDMAFRAPESDIIQISGDPGTGATQSETWSHELSLEQLQQDQLEFEYAQQQDLIDQAYQQQQYGLSAQTQAAQESQFAQNYALQQAEEQRAAALSPYQVESAALANQAASYANMEAARKEQDYQNTVAAQQYNAQKNAWLNGAPMSTGSEAAWNSPSRGTTYQNTPGNYGQSNYRAYLSPAQLDKARYGGGGNYGFA